MDDRPAHAVAESDARFGPGLSISLLTPTVLVIASWCIQFLGRFPIRSPGHSATAAVFMLASVLALIPVTTATVRLKRVPRLRTQRNFLITALGAVALVPMLAVLLALASD
jgi:hypothetical protein